MPSAFICLIWQYRCSPCVLCRRRAPSHSLYLHAGARGPSWLRTPNTPSISRKHLPAAVLVSIGCSVAFKDAPRAFTARTACTHDVGKFVDAIKFYSDRNRELRHRQLFQEKPPGGFGRPTRSTGSRRLRWPHSATPWDGRPDCRTGLFGTCPPVLDLRSLRRWIGRRCAR